MIQDYHPAPCHQSVRANLIAPTNMLGQPTHTNQTYRLPPETMYSCNMPNSQASLCSWLSKCEPVPHPYEPLAHRHTLHTLMLNLQKTKKVLT